MGLRPGLSLDLRPTLAATGTTGLASGDNQSFDGAPDGRWIGWSRRVTTDSLSFSTDGSYAGTHLDGAVYHATWLVRFRRWPSEEEIFVGLSFGGGASGVGLISIGTAGEVFLSNSAGTFAARQDIPTRNDAPFGAGFGSNLVLSLDEWWVLELYYDAAEPDPPPPALAVGLFPWIRLSARVWGTSGSTQAIGYAPTTANAAPAGTGFFGSVNTFLNQFTFNRSIASGPTPATPMWFDLAVHTCQNRIGDETQVFGGLGTTYFYEPAGAQNGFISELSLLRFTHVITPDVTINSGGWIRTGGLGAYDLDLIKDSVRASGITTSQIQSTTPLDVIELEYNVFSRVGNELTDGMVTGLNTISTGGGSQVDIIDPAGPTTLRTVNFASGQGNIYIWTPQGPTPEYTTVPGLLNVRFTRPNNAVVSQIQGMDIAVFSTMQPANHYDPNALSVCLFSDTYDGNGLYQEITLGVGQRGCWVFIAPVGATTVSILAWDTQLVPGAWGSNSPVNAALFRLTPNGFAVIGNDPISNQSGVTYRYFAIADPAHRLLARGAVKMPQGTQQTVAGGIAVPLLSSFVTTGMWTVQDSLVSASVTGTFRGIAHTGNNSSPVNGAEITTRIRSLPPAGPGATWELGTTLNSAAFQVALTFWSTQFFATPLWTFTTYTGNGAGNRTVVQDFEGVAPGLVFVFPHNALGWLRHVDHTGNNSQQIANGTQLTTAIRGIGVDSLDVGTTLNANGILYDVFALLVGNGELCDTLIPPTPGSACRVSLDPGGDSGGIAGCRDTFGHGTDSGGIAGCRMSLVN